MASNDLIEIYNRYRLRDLGFKGMSAVQQAEKVLKEYAEGKRGIIAFYAESHRVMLIERKVWQRNKNILQQLSLTAAPATIIDTAQRLEDAIEHELQKQQKVNEERKPRTLRGRRTWTGRR